MARVFESAGVPYVFTLSGNQIMSVFDACHETGAELIHVRHEASAVHMADAWGRLTGQAGVALVTAGPGFANALSAMYVALTAESPLVVISGHAPQSRAGQGAFQDVAQAEMAGYVTKASWQVDDVEILGRQLAQAFRTAVSGRPGPVHLSLPADVLESAVDALPPVAQPEDFQPTLSLLDFRIAAEILEHLAAARRPLVLVGPMLMRGDGPRWMSEFTAATHVPAVAMESPRGLNDPSLGAFADALAQADLAILIGKKLDFTLQYGESPAFRPDCRVIQVDPEMAVLQQSNRTLQNGARLLVTELADPLPALQRLVHLAGRYEWTDGGWNQEVHDAIAYRPPEWDRIVSPEDGPLHALDVCRSVQKALDGGPDAVFISDGGEFGQWAQAAISAPHRLINGPSGAIGSALPFALAARLANPDANIIATLGDGAFGFHAMEFDTAVRYRLPFVAIVGNDACWNAEYQIQLRKYGAERATGCELLPTRYSDVAQSLGGFGAHVGRPADLEACLQRALECAQPACLNVAIQRRAAPVVRRGQSAAAAAEE